MSKLEKGCLVSPRARPRRDIAETGDAETWWDHTWVINEHSPHLQKHFPNN